jgi:hypothetical protein
MPQETLSSLRHYGTVEAMTNDRSQNSEVMVQEATNVPRLIKPTRIVTPIAENDEVRRWYAVLMFCPPDSFDRVESRWNQPY